MAATPNRQFKNICVLSGFTYGKHKEFVEAAIDLGRSIAARKLHLVYGGGNRGLSKMVSEAAFIRGSQVLGIIPRVLKPLGSSSDSSTGEELVVSGMQERITEMLNHADAFIFLPGDLATLEALITLASWAHLHIHQKPIGLLNVNNFYDGFIAFLNHAPRPPSGKMAKKRVGYSLGGGRGRSSSAGLGMAPDFAGGLRVPKIGHGHSRAQKSAPEGRGANTPQRKNGQKTGGL
ncbi:hypothetical protein WN943_017956 [Citrus x changshan-huyou]